MNTLFIQFKKKVYSLCLICKCSLNRQTQRREIFPFSTNLIKITVNRSSFINSFYYISSVFRYCKNHSKS